MKSIIKKISIVLMTLMLVSSVYVWNDSIDVLADEVSYTVTFHYTRADGNYDTYTIKAYTVSDSEGQKGAFTNAGNEATFTYSFTRDTDLDDSVTFVVQPADGGEAIIKNTQVPLADGSSMDVYISEASAEYSLTPPENAANLNSQGETPAPANPEPQTDVDNPTPGETPTTQAAGDDPNADYSVGMFTAIIIDVIIFAICGVAAYMILGKDKKAAGK